MADKLTKIFMLIDENGDEELTFEEFDDVVNDILVLKAEKKLSASMMKGRFSENMFRDMGVNTEGKINLRAFVDACTKHRFIIINYVENFREGFNIAKDIGEEEGDGDGEQSPIAIRKSLWSVEFGPFGFGFACNACRTCCYSHVS